MYPHKREAEGELTQNSKDHVTEARNVESEEESITPLFLKMQEGDMC